MNRWKYTKDVESSLPIVVMPDGEGTRLKKEVQFIFASNSKTITCIHGGLASVKDESLAAAVSSEQSVSFDEKIVEFTVFETPQGRRAVVLLHSGDVILVALPSVEFPAVTPEQIGDQIKIKAVKKHLKLNKSLSSLRLAYLPLASQRSSVPTVAATYISAANTLTCTLFAVENDNISPRGSTKLNLLPAHATCGYAVAVDFLSPSAADPSRDLSWGVPPLPGASAARGVTAAPEVFVTTTPLDAEHALALPVSEAEAEPAEPVEKVGKRKRKDEPAPTAGKKAKKAASAEEEVLSAAAQSTPPASVRLLAFSTESASLVEVRSHSLLLSAFVPSAESLPLRKIIPAAPCQFLEAAVDVKTKTWRVCLRDAHIGSPLFAEREWLPADAKGSEAIVERFAWVATDAGAALPPDTIVRKTVRALVAVSAPVVSVLHVTVRTVELADVIAKPIASIASDGAPLPTSAKTDAPASGSFLSLSRPAGLVATLDSFGLTEELWGQLRTALDSGSYKPANVQSAALMAETVAQAVKSGLLPHLAVRRLAALACVETHPFSKMVALRESLAGSAQLTGGCIVNLLLAHETLLATTVADCSVTRCLLVDALRESLPVSVAAKFIATLNTWLSLSVNASEAVVRQLAPSIPPVSHMIEFAACLLDAKFLQAGAASGNEDLRNALKDLHATVQLGVQDAKLASTAIATLVGTADAANWLAAANSNAVASVGLGQKLLQVQKLVINFD